MLAFDAIAEQRINEAISRGELDSLPGAGRPLELDDDCLVPEELRMAYRILKNAGFVPPEVEAIRELGVLQRLVASLGEGEARAQAMRKLHLLALQLGEMRGDRLLDAIYHEKVAARLA